MFKKRRNINVLLVGTWAAGRTTMLYKLKLGQVVATIPTIGYNVETIQYNDTDITILEMRSDEKHVELWKNFYSEKHVIIFVMDSKNDIDYDYKLNDTRELLLRTITEIQQYASYAKFCIAFNKQDLDDAISLNDCMERLELDPMDDRISNTFATSAITGHGLYEMLDWIVNNTYNINILQNDNEIFKEELYEIEELYDNANKDKIFEKIEVYEQQIDAIKLEKAVTKQDVFESTKENVEEIAKKFPFEAGLISKYALITTCLGFVYDSCESCGIGEYFAYFIPFLLVLIIPTIIAVKSYKNNKGNEYFIKCIPNIILLFALMLNVCDQPFSCFFGLRISQYFAFIMISGIGCYFKIKSSLYKQKLFMKLLHDKESNNDDNDKLNEKDYNDLIHFAKNKIKKEKKVWDNLFDFIEAISLKYSLEMSTFVIYVNVSTIINFGYIDCYDCDIGEQLLRWLAFIIFLFIPLSLKYFLDYQGILDLLRSIILLFGLILFVETRPLSCYTSSSVPFQITGYVLLAIIGIIALIEKLISGKRYHGDSEVTFLDH